MHEGREDRRSVHDRTPDPGPSRRIGLRLRRARQVRWGNAGLSPHPAVGDRRQRRRLRGGAGGALVQGSAALGANALDFLADSATYAISLWAIGKSVRVRSGAALLKGASLGLLAVFILGFAVWRAISGARPKAR